MKIKLLGKNLDELKKLVAEEGLPGFTAKQIAQWLYQKKVRSIDEMTNLSKVARAKLSEKYEVGTYVNEIQLENKENYKFEGWYLDENLTIPVTNMNQATLAIAPLLERAFMFLEDENWEEAIEYLEKVLDNDPENAQAYLGKLMADLKVKKKKDIVNCKEPFDKNANYI